MKDFIIIILTATTCNLGCKFCHLTGLNLKLRNLSGYEIYKPTDDIISEKRHYNIENNIYNNKILLVSFMGCGEPLYNIDNIMEAAWTITFTYDHLYDIVRFAVASLIPTHNLFKKFTKKVEEEKLKCKLHYSLHTTNEHLRKDLMPKASPICIDLIVDYMNRTNNSAEIHYTLMEGINDSDEDAKNLSKLLANTNINAKLLKFSEKSSEPTKSSIRFQEFKKILEDYGITTEYYEPPGADIGSSCGQFLLDYYKESNVKY